MNGELSMQRLFKPEDDAVRAIHDQLARSKQMNGPMSSPLRSVELVTREQVSVLIETAFWASLRCNEGRRTRVCVTVAAPQDVSVPLATPVAYDESQIVNLAPAVTRGACLVVSASSKDDGLIIQGFGRSEPRIMNGNLMIEVSAPGKVRVDICPYQPFAMLDGRSNPILQGTPTTLTHHLRVLLGKPLPVDDRVESLAAWWECLALVDVVRMIAAEGHGGTVIIVPTETGDWSKSLNPFVYRFKSPDNALHYAIRQELKDTQCRGNVENATRTITSLSDVDGAVVMTRDMRVLGFGAKIAAACAECVRMLEPPDFNAKPSNLESLGGTRHQSAARFTAANPDAVAIVVSQDRHVSVMHWDALENSVLVFRSAEWWV
jgi:hypothetical protein